MALQTHSESYLICIEVGVIFKLRISRWVKVFVTVSLTHSLRIKAAIRIKGLELVDLRLHRLPRLRLNERCMRGAHLCITSTQVILRLPFFPQSVVSFD